jgi:2-desacetyl-2-hydroxyethyl bacteriochlorophyllide A dehydrogenase
LLLFFRATDTLKKNDTTMKAAVFTGEPGVQLRDVPAPEICHEEALMKVHSVGVCGSDLFICSGKNPRVKPPVIPGHEVVGEILEIRTESETALGLNDRVAVVPNISCGTCSPCQRGLRHLCTSLKVLGAQADGGYAEYMKVPLSNLLRLPEKLAFDKAVLAEPLAVAVHAVRRAHIDVADRAVVIGAGPIGLLVAQVARLSGCASVIVVDLAQSRLQLAREFGFETILASQINPVDEIRAMTDGVGVDIVFECVGHPSTIPQLTAITKERGQIVVVGLFKELAPTDWFQVQRKEQDLTGAWMYHADDFARALTLLGQGNVDPGRLISHTFPLKQAQEAMNLVRDAKNSMKVVLSNF